MSWGHEYLSAVHCYHSENWSRGGRGPSILPRVAERESERGLEMAEPGAAPGRLPVGTRTQVPTLLPKSTLTFERLVAALCGRELGGKGQGWGPTINSYRLLPACETWNSLRRTSIFKHLFWFLYVDSSPPGDGTNVIRIWGRIFIVWLRVGAT